MYQDQSWNTIIKSRQTKLFILYKTREMTIQNWQNSRGGVETYTLNPNFLLQDIDIDFFDFKFIMNADWTLKETKFKDEVIDPAIWNSLFLIKEKYFKKVSQHKQDVEKIDVLKEKIKTDEKNYLHRKHCYQQAIYEHQRACDHFRRTVRAFEQMAKCNEKAQRELEYNKQKWWFSIWSE